MTSKLLIVDSEHRITGDSSNAFTVSFNNSNLDRVKSVSLIAMRTINSQYNVNLSNNVISYNYNGVEKKVTVPVGFYDSASFIAAVNALQTDFVLDLNTLLFKFTWTSSGLPLIIYTDEVSDELIGVTSNLVDAVGGVTLTSQNMPDLSGLSIIHVASNKLGHSNSILSNKSNGNIISSVPVNAQFGFPIVYESQTTDSSDNHSYQVPQNLNTIDVELLDHGYAPLRLNSEVHLVFKVFLE